jgi:hypothetical protein
MKQSSAFLSQNQFTLLFLFIGGIVAIIIYGIRRQARWIYVQFLEEDGKTPMKNMKIIGRRGSSSHTATYMGNYGGNAQYHFERSTTEGKPKEIGITDENGCFKMRVAWSNYYALQIDRKKKIHTETFDCMTFIQHISQTGGYPEKPFVVSMKDQFTSILMPKHLL